MRRKLLRPFKRVLIPLAVRLIGRLLRISGVVTPEHFKYWEMHGWHITPVHFYQPIPDTRTLAQNYPGRFDLLGVDWQPDAQIGLLRDSLAVYASETAAFPAQSSDPDTFYLDNGLFVGIDPHVYYCMVRHFKPRIIVEVGAGFSTLVAAQAAAKNRSEGSDTRVIAVEPYPRPFIQRGAHGIEHIAKRAEDLDSAFFAQLGENDILFIDSSHVVKTGGDVVSLVLGILPRLAPGVIVHIHDIFLPYDYPPAWTLEKHWFWTEQYIIQALLIENRRAQVLIGNHFVEREYEGVLREVFPSAHRWTGGSLWFRLR